MTRRGQYSSTNILSIPVSLPETRTCMHTEIKLRNHADAYIYFKSLQQQCDLGGLTSVKCSVYEAIGIAKKKIRGLV